MAPDIRSCARSNPVSPGAGATSTTSASNWLDQRRVGRQSARFRGLPKRRATPSAPNRAIPHRRHVRTCPPPLVTRCDLRYRQPPVSMMGLETNFDDVEALLSRDTRAQLPLRRQILLYLNPFALFKDAARGPVSMRERALAYNRAMRWVLLPYIRRYILIAAVLFLGIAPAEALAAETSILIIPAAAAAVGCCIALCVAVCAWVGYVLLGARSERS